MMRRGHICPLKCAGVRCCHPPPSPSAFLSKDSMTPAPAGFTPNKNIIPKSALGRQEADIISACPSPTAQRPTEHLSALMRERGQRERPLLPAYRLFIFYWFDLYLSRKFHRDSFFHVVGELKQKNIQYRDTGR